jgi:molecular chaperone HscC
MIIGIDLGTTNSLVAVWRDGAPVLIPNALGQVLTPSVVSLDEPGNLLVGVSARERLVSHPDRTAAAFKRWMGTDREIALDRRHKYRPEELSAMVLRALKADAEAFLGEPVTEAVITIPAYFSDAQRKATKTAGELAGLKVRRLLTEPTAAALAYGIGLAGEDEEMPLVVDLGGGTFDVSLLQCFEGISEVRATAGDSRLGGEDFVDALVGAFLAGPGKMLPGPEADPVLHGALRRQAELAKRELTVAEETVIEIVHGETLVTWKLSRTEFEEIATPVLARLRAPIERALRDARVAPDQISRIIMAGGASRMPCFRRMIARLFRSLPVQTIDPDAVVALGAACAAGMVARDASLEERVLTDVAPFSLGVEVVAGTPGNWIQGLFMPIIERNTVIPVSKSKPFRTVADNQRKIDIKVYQGEARLVQDNILLGQFFMEVPPAPRGSQAFEVRFTYDTSGLLEVEAVAAHDGTKRVLVIEGNPGVLTQDEIPARLAALNRLKIHPRDDEPNRALTARAARLYEERLGDARLRVGEALVQFMSILESQEPDRIAAAREGFTRLLDEIDQDNFL